MLLGTFSVILKLLVLQSLCFNNFTQKKEMKKLSCVVLASDTYLVCDYHAITRKNIFGRTDVVESFTMLLFFRNVCFMPNFN